MLKILFISILLTACSTPEPTTVKVGGNNPIESDDLINRYTVRMVGFLKHKGKYVRTFGCSGTVLDSQHVLIAAHCVDNNPWRIKIIIGDDSKVKLPNGELYSAVAEVKSVAFHNGFSNAIKKQSFKLLTNIITFGKRPKEMRMNDIAVLRLTKPLNLPYPIDYTIPDEPTDLSGTSVVNAGYGIGDIGQIPMQGRKSETKVIHDFGDLLEFQNFFNRINFGDSGGPVWRYDENNKLQLIGVHSFLIWTFKMHSFSIDIRHYKQWIENAKSVLKNEHMQIPKKYSIRRLFLQGVLEDFYYEQTAGTPK